MEEDKCYMECCDVRDILSKDFVYEYRVVLYILATL